MIKLLSLPQGIVDCFKFVEPIYASEQWYCTSDPKGFRLGSGGGTTWLLDRWEEAHGAHPGTKKIIIHAGGESRRLPAYSIVGKLLTPVPVMRWSVGERINQNLLDLQLPLLEQIMKLSPKNANTLIASGDVCIRTDIPLTKIPEADVVCFGIWAEPNQASHHGVFLSSRTKPDVLDFMLQKPSVDELSQLSRSHFFLMDVGLWLLSDRALEVLRHKSKRSDGSYCFYDLYSNFGCALGASPSHPDPEVSNLSISIVPINGGEFYHFGTTRELLSSTLALQCKVADQRKITNKAKIHPSLFVQNCLLDRKLNADNSDIWIENAFIAPQWQFTSANVVTGIPVNNWPLKLTPGSCIDIVPAAGDGWILRPYGFNDAMRGDTALESTTFLNNPLTHWAQERDIEIPHTEDIYKAPIFPVINDIDKLGIVARWMISEPHLTEGKNLWRQATRLSADEIAESADLQKLYRQRGKFLAKDLEILAHNHAHSVFYHLDLNDTAKKFVSAGLTMPDPLSDQEPADSRMRNHMLRSRILSLSGKNGSEESEKAFAIMREQLLSTLDSTRSLPRLDAMTDQIVWSRSPLRIDLAGGWTDTPPYSIFSGGSVINMAVELNGQQPLQVFVKPSKEPTIIIRSIDLGASEKIETFEQLLDFKKVGSPFSLPKAALALAGFAPGFCPEQYSSLKQQLSDFGSGLEITLLSAVPAGSGMGTSSILAATVLGALSNFCGLAWDTTELCSRTLALEQLLTTGGGWQDQYGGVLQGVKMLTTMPGLYQQPIANWLPDNIFTDPEYSPCHILYYTGITRTAKGILAEIVERMFLNERSTLNILNRMQLHTQEMAKAIQRCDFNRYGCLIAETWRQNQALDKGTNPPAVKAIIDRISDYTLGLKLPGAGGGGFIYMVAKDPEAASRIRHILTTNTPNTCARFVDLTVSTTGLQISRS